MKKKLAWALVLCLMMQLLPGTAFPALAAQAEPALPALAAQAEPTTMHVVSGPPAEESAEDTTGILEVKVTSALPIETMSKV